MIVGEQAAVSGIAAEPPRGVAARIDVVVPVYNKVRLLGDAVGSIVAAAEAHGAAELWFVDNGSTDGSYELLVEQFGARASILRLMSGTIAAVRNLGAGQGRAAIISFLDCDCRVPADYFARLEMVMAETDADATGCAVVLPPNPTWVEAVWNRMHDDGGDGSRTWINSANFAVRREMFERIGGFNAACETDEDTEICARIRQAGGRLMSDRRLAVEHLDNAKTLPAFFLKERWRGLGMFSATSAGSIDKPTAMMIVHIVSLLGAVAVVTIAPLPPVIRMAIAGLLLLLVPAITVIYRRRSSVARFDPIRAVVLYEIFYAARISAFVAIIARAVRRQT